MPSKEPKANKQQRNYECGNKTGKQSFLRLRYGFMGFIAFL
jgi:hypothetical protein